MKLLAGLAVLAHFYSTNDALSRQSLQKNAAHISVASPVWLTVTENGQVRSGVDPQTVAWARERKLRLMPVVANEDFRPEIARAVLDDEKVLDQLVAQLVRIAEAEGFYGLDLDFENFGPEGRAGYVRLAKRLGRELRKRKMTLGVAVGAPLGAGLAPNEHSRVFDYAELGQAADWITLMTYDEHTSPDQPGPIAGYGWVEACLRKTLELIPREKLLLGLPLYYRRWNGKDVSEGPYLEARALALRHRTRIRMDPVHQAPRFQFRAAKVRNVVWLENARSLGRRLELVRKYHLAGFSAWRLGQEDPAVWPAVFGRMPKP
jgi:spore germination protein YaaH